MSMFVQKYIEIVEKKNSILCVGLDPALPSQRENYVMPTDDRIAFMKSIIYDVAPYASAIKMNRQYLIGLSVDELRQLNILIHQQDMISIIDHKLGDIGSSNASAIFWFKEEGFDAFTFNPFAGNIAEATKLAHENGLGIIVLTLMSNPEAVIQKEAKVNDEALYLRIAKECGQAKVDGVVIGATGHITSDDIKSIRMAVGSNCLALVPGVGVQGGSANTILHYFGSRAMINVGRGIIYSEDPAKAARMYNNQFNEQRTRINRNRIRF